jgi:hypothetical protein
MQQLAERHLLARIFLHEPILGDVFVLPCHDDDLAVIARVGEHVVRGRLGGRVFIRVRRDGVSDDGQIPALRRGEIVSMVCWVIASIAAGRSLGANSEGCASRPRYCLASAWARCAPISHNAEGFSFSA